MGTFRRVLVVVAVLYLAALAVVWEVGDRVAERQMLDLLEAARNDFGNRCDLNIDNVLWYAAATAALHLQRLPPERRTREEMVRLKEFLHMDELNQIGTNGVVFASSESDVLGYDFHLSVPTREYLDLFRPDAGRTFLSQPFRCGAANPDAYCKYLGVVSEDRQVITQVGCSLRRYVASFSYATADDYKHWRIGESGHYGLVDENHDGMADECASDLRELGPPTVDGQGLDAVYTLAFPYYGYKFTAVLPARECYDQRFNNFCTTALVTALLLVVLGWFGWRYRRSAERVVACYREMDRRNAEDLKIASTIQMSVLPRGELFLLDDLRLTVGAGMCPAREVGGDFYDFFRVANDRVALAVADVSGKGVPASMFMLLVMNTMRVGLMYRDNLADAVEQCNDYLCRHNEAEMFVTGIFGILDPASGEFEFVNAGHNRPFVLRRDGRLERIDARGGRFLGMFPGVTYRSSRIRLGDGDRLFLYTDGVTEAMNPLKRTYGEARLKAVLASRPEWVEDVLDAVLEDVERFVDGAERSDDLTMLCVEKHQGGAREARTFPATTVAVGEALDFLRGRIRLRDARQVSRLLNAVDEALSNVVNYSGASDFEVAVEAVPGRALVTVSDAGREYDPLKHSDPDVHAKLEDRPVGGLGILMAKKLVTSVRYQRLNGRNVLMLVQHATSRVFRQGRCWEAMR